VQHQKNTQKQSYKRHPELLPDGRGKYITHNQLPSIINYQLLIDYTTPWSIIALATFRKPAMLAPFT
jgi:hypothetical protein